MCRSIAASRRLPSQAAASRNRAPPNRQRHMQPKWDLKRARAQRGGNAVGIVNPVRAAEPYAVPVDLRVAQQLVGAQCEAVCPDYLRDPETIRDQCSHEPVEAPI